MNGMDFLIPQTVADICAQAGLLDKSRLRMFLDWLCAHHHTDAPIFPDGLSGYLKTWFETLSLKGVLWEYHVILNEIAWWHELDLEKLLRLSKGNR